VGELLELHRSRLRRVVSARLDRRLEGRLDASDVVQEAMLEASRRLPDYLSQAEVPFFAWLRALAMSRMIDAHRTHLADKRSVRREVGGLLPPNDGSLAGLVDRLAGRQSSPSAQLIRGESRARVREALDRLPESSRELLVLRYIEGLSPGETAAVLQTPERTIRRRHRDALVQLSQLLGHDGDELS
jgi:RNA polymerase sigma-70 factor (ECF subfamily)